MRHSTRFAAPALAALALMLAGGASDALAAEFITTPEASLQVTSGTAGAQRFRLGPFTIGCAAAKGSGVVASSQVMSADVKFSHCQDSVQVGGETLSSPAKFDGPVGFLWSASGLTALGRFSVTVKNPRCTIVAGRPDGGQGGGGLGVPIVASSGFANQLDAARNLRLFPTGFQHEVAIETETETVEVGYQGACSGFASSEEGAYSGDFTASVVRGNLEGQGEEGSGWNRLKNKEE